MKIKPTPLAGLFEIEPQLRGDARGFFTRAFCLRSLSEQEINFIPVQANHASSSVAGTLRGLHFQKNEHAEDKLMRCIKGAIFDVAVDLRPGSETYLKWFGCELSEANKKMLLVPRGFAHGYLTLTANTEVYYLVTNYYAPRAEGGLKWDDPKIGIDWPLSSKPILSEKDESWPLL